MIFGDKYEFWKIGEDFSEEDGMKAGELENEFGDVSKPLNLPEIQKQMPENVQILQYSLLENKLAIWLITKNRFELTRLLHE